MSREMIGKLYDEVQEDVEKVITKYQERYKDDQALLLTSIAMLTSAFDVKSISLKRFMEYIDPKIGELMVDIGKESFEMANKAADMTLKEMPKR